MGLRRAKLDNHSGESIKPNADGESELLLVSAITHARQGRQVQVSLLRFDRCSRLQSFLLQQVYNTKEAYSIFRRLGLPESSVANKLPYYDSALGEGGHARVTLTPWMNAALAADTAEPDTALRPKPRFRTHAPGFVEVVAANVALMWACATIKV